jgi:hypothetical protein
MDLTTVPEMASKVNDLLDGYCVLYLLFTSHGLHDYLEDVKETKPRRMLIDCLTERKYNHIKIFCFILRYRSTTKYCNISRGDS